MGNTETTNTSQYFDLDAQLFRAFLDDDTSRGERRLIAALLGFDAEDVVVDLDADGRLVDLTHDCDEAYRLARV